MAKAFQYCGCALHGAPAFLGERKYFFLSASRKRLSSFHLCFENIQPFADGNGRVGRTLLNYYLIAHNHLPLIVYDEDKADYYAALERFDADEDIAPMLAFLERETVKTWERKAERSR